MRDPRGRRDVAHKLNALVDAGLECDGKDEPKRTYLGGSRIGEPCYRRLGYEYEVALGRREGEAFKGKSLRRFRMGHMHEAETARWLRSVDFDLQTEGPDGKQLGFDTLPRDDGSPRLSGHYDGIIHGGPEDLDLPYPLLWEHKIMKASSWASCAKSGVRDFSPVYYGQLQIYMRYADLNNALFTALNTDTSQLHFEIVEYDRKVANEIFSRAMWIIAETEIHSPRELPRIAASPSSWHCKFCPFADECWSKPKASPGKTPWKVPLGGTG